jgi:hypothetical protein
VGDEGACGESRWAVERVGISHKVVLSEKSMGEKENKEEEGVQEDEDQEDD